MGVLGAAVAAAVLAASVGAGARLRLDSMAGSVRMRRLWGTAVKPADSGDVHWFSSNDPLIQALPKWSTPAGRNTTLPFSDGVSRVRLLGGWKAPAASEPDPGRWRVAANALLNGTGGGDFVTVARNGSRFVYTADWRQLYARLDTSVAQLGLPVVAVFDNVPWAFSRNASRRRGVYGNVWGPDEDLVPVYTAFVRDMVRKLRDRYGAAAGRAWLWRVGTEPNCGCHWLDSPAHYVRNYEIITTAVKDVFGAAARVAPGNFPRGLAMDVVQDVISSLAHNVTHPPDVLGISYYGGAANGYRATDMAGTYQWMRKLAAELPNAADVDIHFMEYGTLETPFGRGMRSNEPGVFGAAWTLNGWAVALQQGISQTYHWNNMDHVQGVAGRRRGAPGGGGGAPLLFGFSWLFALGELMVRGRAVVMDTTLPFSTDRNATSVVAVAVAVAAAAPGAASGGKAAARRAHVAGPDPSRSDSGHGPAPEAFDANASVLIAVSAFATHCYNSTGSACGLVPTTVVLARSAVPAVLQAPPRPRGGRPAGGRAAPGSSRGPGHGIVVEEWSLSWNTSWYDRIWRDLKGSGGLQRPGDGYVYQLAKLANAAGHRSVASRFEEYNEMQLRALRPQPFAGTTASNQTHIVLTFQAARPSVRFLRITRA